MKLLALGPEGTYGHQVALEVRRDRLGFSGDVEIVLVGSHQEIFAQVDSDPETTRGIVAIENSIGGLVAEVIGCWVNPVSATSLCVLGEAFVPVRHRLLVRPGTKMSQVSKVFSHPQAISQCRGFLAREMLTAVPVSSTAEGARIVASSDEPIAAIASEFAARQFELESVRDDLADNAQNMTRFHLIGGACSLVPAGTDVTAILFRVPNEPGSLVSALSAISQEGVNASSIHSVPNGQMSDYVFYCEINCHQDDSRGKNVLIGLRGRTTHLRVLGSYPQAQKPQ